MVCFKLISASDTDKNARCSWSVLSWSQNQILRNATRVSVVFCIVILVVLWSKISLLKFPSFNLFSVTTSHPSLQLVANTSHFLSNLTRQMPEPHTLELGQTLNAINTTLRSSNKRYILILKPSGDLQMSRLSIDIDTGSLIYNRLWWTSTDDHFPSSTYQVHLTSNGVLELINFNPHSSWPKTGVAVWKSDMYRHCHRQSSFPVINPKLILADDGRLTITSTHGVLCTLFSDVWSPLEKPHGRLAVVITGFIRINEETCASHRALLNNWKGEVHVYVGTYLQEVYFRNKSIIVNEESIRAHLISCYGKMLKDYLIRDVNQVAENFVLTPKEANGPTIPILGHHNRLLSQLRNIYDTAELLRDNMMHSSIAYSYIFKFRPDTNFLSPLIDINGVISDTNRLLLVHPKNEHYFYCNTHDGKEYVGPSDQTAFGRTSLMFTYLDMYLYFSDLVKVSYGTKRPFERNFSAMYIPKATYETPGTAIECYIPYYLVLRGIEYEVIWNWNSGVLRNGGVTTKSCGRNFNF